MSRLKLKRTWPFVRLMHRYSRRRGLLQLLPPRLLSPVIVEAEDRPANPSGRLATAWLNSGRSHKWRHYFPVYEGALSRLIGTPARILEIGVAGGGSLQMWKNYLGEGATIVGIDIDAQCAHFERAGDRLFVRIGSQSDPRFLSGVAAEFGPFDAIIDDGSHVLSHMVTSFGALFADGLKPGGVYIVEDTHSTYWTKYRDRPFAFSDFVRDLIDLRHAPYWGAPHSTFFEASADNRLRQVAVPALSAMLDQIEVHDSMALIHKQADQPSLPVHIRA